MKKKKKIIDEKVEKLLYIVFAIEVFFITYRISLLFYNDIKKIILILA